MVTRGRTHLILHGRAHDGRHAAGLGSRSLGCLDSAQGRRSSGDGSESRRHLNYFWASES
jgi:hypothetical protein